MLALGLLLATLAAAAAQPGTELRGKVVKVRDGDSMEIRRAGENVGVRVFGVDSPERGQPWSARAKSFTAGLVGNQDVVVVVKDVDRYGRMVGDVVLADGRHTVARAAARGARLVLPALRERPGVREARGRGPRREARPVERAAPGAAVEVPPRETRRVGPGIASRRVG